MHYDMLLIGLLLAGSPIWFAIANIGGSRKRIAMGLLANLAVVIVAHLVLLVIALNAPTKVLNEWSIATFYTSPMMIGYYFGTTVGCVAGLFTALLSQTPQLASASRH